ncbi:MAG: sugar phosphate isomerase/epimerase [Clostridia bacterium]|nr:sugar phosphate isomerase/epimerase [Clostridia bacterium]
MNLGIQMWSVHDHCVEKGFEEVFRIVKEMGYTGFEYALGGDITLKDRCGIDARTASEAAGKMDMKILGCHMPVDKVLSMPEEVLKECQALELPYVGIGSPFKADRTSFENQKKIQQQLGRAARFFKENGVQMQIHCGVSEFLYDYEDKYVVDGLMDAVGAEYLQPEFDTQWLMCCGVDIESMFKKYKGHIDVVHLKDSLDIENKYRYLMAKYDEICDRFNEEGFAVGNHGMLDLQKAVASAGENGAKWLVVELWNEKNSLEHAEISAENIRKYM